MRGLLVLIWFSMVLYGGEIRVAVAANVSYAIDDLIGAFHTLYPDVKVTPQLGSSGKLAVQIMHGAPYDIFMSANMAYPQRLYEQGDAVTRPLVYAQGSLALFSTHAADMKRGLALLRDPAIKRIAIANPKTAPYGKAAKEALQKAGLWESIQSRLIYGESISQTVTYATTAADVGLIATSSLYSPHMRSYQKGKNWQLVDPRLYQPISQGVVLLKRAQHNRDAAAFFTFLFSQKSEAILRKYGYLIP